MPDEANALSNRTPQTSVVFKEGVTALLVAGTLPVGGLCGRTFNVQFAAKNGAGYSTTYTTTATYAMPACASEWAAVPVYIAVRGMFIACFRCFRSVVCALRWPG